MAEKELEKERVFTAKVGDKDVELYIKDPSYQEMSAAKAYSGKAFNQAVTDKLKFRTVLQKQLREEGVWTDEKEAKHSALELELSNIRNKLVKGGMTKSQGRDLAIKMRQIRIDMRELKSEMADLENNTVEGQASNAEFNYLVASCLVYNDNRKKKYFKNVDEYLSNSSSDPAAVIGAIKFAQINYGLNTMEERLVENQFLKKYGFVDDDLRLVDENGRLVDDKGRFIDEGGRFVKYLDDGSTVHVDLDGNELDEDGNYKFGEFTEG